MKPLARDWRPLLVSHPMKYTLLLPLLLVSCVGPMTWRSATLPDGHKVRAYRAGALVAPSVTVVAVRAPGSTNWTLPHVFSGPGLLPGVAANAGITAALLLPDRDNNQTQTQTVVVAEDGIGGEGGGEVDLKPKPKHVKSPEYKSKKW